MNKVQEIKDALKGEENPMEIIDSVLHSGTVELGNQNDFANMAMRVAPNLSSEELEDLQKQLRTKEVKEGEKLIYKLTTESSEQNVYEIKIGNLFLTFNKL